LFVTTKTILQNVMQCMIVDGIKCNAHGGTNNTNKQINETNTTIFDVVHSIYQ